jgi:hypothetical protein
VGAIAAGAQAVVLDPGAGRDHALWRGRAARVRKTVESRLRTVEERLGRTLHPCSAELELVLLLEELVVGSGV